MKTHEQILKGARDRWNCNTDTESLICEVHSLLNEIEIYRECLRGVRSLLDVTVCTLREKRG